MSALQHVDIYTDGSCRPNGMGGWAASLYAAGSNLNTLGNEPNTTNNRMELYAVIKGLEQLQYPCDVTIYTDSKYVCDGINEWLGRWAHHQWRTKKGTPIEHQDLWQIIYRSKLKHRIHAVWVKGHAGHPANEAVDSLAQLMSSM